ncbi:Uncharacterised protein [Vibrio cholerae]|nr:Uncharacterised protein [Vibrio cholerae]CSB85359.1 Uncharacterised protein [Vibrio cholerae]CSI63055.1 Uncharacterised protein [Vibrio cholerae]
MDLGFGRIEDLEHLLLVRFRVTQYIFARQRWACGVFSCWIPHHSSKVTNQKCHVMT